MTIYDTMYDLAFSAALEGVASGLDRADVLTYIHENWPALAERMDGIELDSLLENARDDAIRQGVEREDIGEGWFLSERLRKAQEEDAKPYASPSAKLPAGWTPQARTADEPPNPVVGMRPTSDGGTAHLHADGTVSAYDGSFYSVAPGFDSFEELEAWLAVEGPKHLANATGNDDGARVR